MSTFLKMLFILVQAPLCFGLVALILIKPSEDGGGGSLMGGPMQTNVRIQGADDTIAIWTKRLATAFLIVSFIGGVIFSVRW